MLRVLYIPRITGPNTSSGVRSMLRVLRDLGENFGVLPTVWLPIGASVADDSSGVLQYVFGSRMIKDMSRFDVCEYDSSLFDILHSKKFLSDVIVTDNQFLNSYMYLLQYEPKFGLNIPDSVPVVTWVTESLDHTNVYYRQNPVAMPLAAMASLAGPLTYASETVKSEFIEASRWAVSPVVLKKLLDGEVIPPSTERSSEELSDTREKKRKHPNKGLTVLCVGDPKEDRWEILIKAAEKVWEAGKVIRVLCFVRNNIPAYLHKPFVSFPSAADSDDVTEAIVDSDFFFIGSSVYSMDPKIYELLSCGVLPIVYNDSKGPFWLREIVKDDTYFASNAKELAALLNLLCSGYGDPDTSHDRSCLGGLLSDRARMFHLEEVSSKWMALLTGAFLSTDRDKYTSGMFVEMVAALKPSVSAPLSSKVLGAMLKSASRTKSVDPSVTLSPAAFRRLMRFCGFRDVGTVYEEAWEPIPEEWVK